MKIIILLISAIGMLRAQEPSTSLRLRLAATDQEGRRHRITCGLDARATYGYDLQLGEEPVPPSPPPGIFDFRFTDLPGHRRIPAEGTYMDIRALLHSPAQCDTFIVNCQATLNKYPMTIALEDPVPPEVDSMIVEPLPIGSGASSDLKKAKTLGVTSEESARFRMILYSHKERSGAN